MLEAEEIQGNVLGGFNKDLQVFMFLRMAENDLVSTRSWLHDCAARLTWLDEVASFKKKFRAFAGGTSGADPGNLSSIWMNIALSYPALLRDATQFDPVFAGGMAAAVGRLGDPVDPNVRGHISKWIFGASGKIPDILLIIAADREEDLLDRLASERALVEQAGLVEMHIDYGRDLGRTGAPGSFPPGREHFGFKDGVSQPAVRGRLSPGIGDYLAPRDGSSPAGTTIEFASPGRPLICPGEFVLGYPRQSAASGRNAAAPWPLGNQANDVVVGVPPIGPLWARNGSFLVYRRLNQDVPAFNRFLSRTARELSSRPEDSGLTPEHFGAMVVGRWRSGAPLLRASAKDDERLARTLGANNDFDFLSAGTAADGFPPAIIYSREASAAVKQPIAPRSP